jgi:hypothetical protein
MKDALLMVMYGDVDLEGPKWFILDFFKGMVILDH